MGKNVRQGRRGAVGGRPPSPIGLRRGSSRGGAAGEVDGRPPSPIGLRRGSSRGGAAGEVDGRRKNARYERTREREMGKNARRGRSAEDGQPRTEERESQAMG